MDNESAAEGLSEKIQESTWFATSSATSNQLYEKVPYYVLQKFDEKRRLCKKMITRKKQSYRKKFKQSYHRTELKALENKKSIYIYICIYILTDLQSTNLTKINDHLP